MLPEKGGKVGVAVYPNLVRNGSGCQIGVQQQVFCGVQAHIYDKFRYARALRCTEQLS